MRPKLLSMAAVMTLLFAATSHAQSLADLAKKEKERRDKVKTESPAITNKDTGKYAGGAVTTQTPLPGPRKSEQSAASSPEVGSGAKPAAAEKPAPDEPTDLMGRPESFWRQTFIDARKKVKDLEDEQRVLQLKLTDLQNRFYREDSGYRQQDLQREINKTYYEQDLNKQSLAKARDELQQLEVEARKNGALPGWIEAKP